MKNASRKRLQLSSETLQRIGADELVVALGGAAANPVSGGSCAGFGCGLTGHCTKAQNCGGHVVAALKHPALHKK